MFSGLVETIGTILQTQLLQDCITFIISPATSFKQLTLGESIAVNGVCLTVTDFDEESFSVTAVPETLNLTNLKSLQVGSMVNLERAIKMGDRLGGHLVQGHVDAQGQILSLVEEGAALLVKISLPTHLAKYVVAKGYITLDGMSITVIEAQTNWFSVTFIPHTQAVTIIPHYQVGTSINLEIDITAKYIEKLLGASSYAFNHTKS